MVAVTRATAAGIAILCALNNVAATSALAGDASSNEARDLVDSEPTLDARDLTEDVLETRGLMEDADAGLDKRYPPFHKDVMKKLKFQKAHRSLDEELSERDFDDALYERDLDDISPLEIRAIMDGSHPDAVVVNKRFFKLLKMGFKGVKKLAGLRNNRHKRSLDEELSERDFDEDLDERDFDDDSLLEARDAMDDISDYFEARGIEETDAMPNAPGPKGFRKGAKGLRPGAKGFPKGAKGLRPGVKGFPKGAKGLRPGAKGFPKGAKGLRPGAKGLRPGVKGFRKGAKGLRPGAKGFPKGAKGLRPGVKGIRKGPKGYFGGVAKADS